MSLFKEYDSPMVNVRAISILIPCHSLKYLRQSVESVANQTLPYEMFEVVLVGDRIDLAQTREILKNSSINFRILESLNPGIVPALNLGLSAISSKYVARMDDDDIMLPDRLQKQFNFLEENPAHQAVGGQLQFIDENGDHLGYSRYERKVDKNSKSLLRVSPLAHPATMFVREKVIEIGGYRDFLPEDWDLWVRLCENGSVANLDDVVLKYRTHRNQLSRSGIYRLDEARYYIATSYFARKFGLRDHPINLKMRKKWLLETSVELRKVSKEYEIYERKIQNNLEFEKQIKMIKEKKELRGVAQLVLQYPFQTLKMSIRKFLRRTN